MSSSSFSNTCRRTKSYLRYSRYSRYLCSSRYLRCSRYLCCSRYHLYLPRSIVTSTAYISAGNCQPPFSRTQASTLLQTAGLHSRLHMASLLSHGRASLATRTGLSLATRTGLSLDTHGGASVLPHRRPSLLPLLLPPLHCPRPHPHQHPHPLIGGYAPTPTSPLRNLPLLTSTHTLPRLCTCLLVSSSALSPPSHREARRLSCPLRYTHTPTPAYLPPTPA